MPEFSAAFRRLYCDASLFATFSALHPISFHRVLPFQAEDAVMDDQALLGAEAAHLAEPNDLTRREVIEAYARCDLISAAEAGQVQSVIDDFAADFFGLMGMIYANEDMFICALRWYGEFIRRLENPSSGAGPSPDSDGVYASVGYCLYSLGLYEEAIAWSKSCLGPDHLTDLVCRAVVGYEAQMAGGTLLAVERVHSGTRYTICAPAGEAQVREATRRLQAALGAIAPAHMFYFDWVSPGLAPQTTSGGPFRSERDAGDLPRHRMNLIFAACGWADALPQHDHADEARRLLHEAALLEPGAGFLWDRIRALG
jgi:tetratricopeptide (TPR) repeat protein